MQRVAPQSLKKHSFFPLPYLVSAADYKHFLNSLCEFPGLMGLEGESQAFPALHSSHINGGCKIPGQSGSHNRLLGDYLCNLQPRRSNKGIVCGGPQRNPPLSVKAPAD